MADALKLAADDGNLKEVERLIKEENVPVNQADAWGDTALHAAVAKGRLNIVTFLLKNGADPNVQNGAGSTPLHKAAVCKHDQLQILRLLLEKNADPLIQNKSNMLAEQLAPGDLAKRILVGQESFVEDHLDIPRSKHGRIIGKAGIKMKQVQTDSGAHVTIPKQEAQSDRIIIKGRKEAVAKAKQLILELVGGEEGGEDNRMSTKFQVPKDKHRLIIGKGGATVNEIREKANVDIIIPNANSKDEFIIIKGDSPDGIESAIKEIQRITGSVGTNNNNNNGAFGRKGSNGNFGGRDGGSRDGGNRGGRGR